MSEKGVEELLKRLEVKYLERESADIQRAIDRTGEASPTERDELMRKKSEVMRRKAELDGPESQDGFPRRGCCLSNIHRTARDS